MLSDSHAHLTSPELLEDLEGVLERAKSAHVLRILNICTDELSLDAGLELSLKEPSILCAAAATPHDVARFGDSFFERVAQEAQRGVLAAIGETGLDYHYEHAPRALQQEHLLRYLALAKELKLPLIFHCREAFKDLFAITDAHVRSNRVALHCFTGTLDEARAVIERGWFLSISGIVTFKKAEWLQEVVREVPLEQLLIETDAPYLAPGKWRGRRNEPAYLVETAECIAQLRNMNLQELAAATTRNLERLIQEGGP